MFALTALIAIGIWGGIGFVIWRFLILPHLRSKITKICVTIILALIWFVGPVIDEILGVREFDQFCRGMPSDKFYGPIAVGPGVFFDEQGRPKWKNSDEFSAIKRNTDVWWKQIFLSDGEVRTIRKWPMPIVERHWIIRDRATGNITAESFNLHAIGGWLRRLIEFGDYQCPSKGRWPPDEEWIIFKTNQ